MTKIFTKEWFIATGVRMIKTFAEGFLSVTGTTLIRFMEVDWIGALSVGAVASIISFAFALKGLPEVKDSDDE